MAVTRENARDVAKDTGYTVPIGEIIDQLSICNIKMWHTDEGISKAEAGGDYAQAGKLAVMARQLNAKRADLREEINMRLDGRGAGTNKIEYCKEVSSR